MSDRPFKGNPVAVTSLLVLLMLLLIAMAWPLVMTLVSRSGPAGAQFAQQYQPEQLSSYQFRHPNSKHWFGTDVHGRDLFARVLYGTQMSVLVGLLGAG